MSGEISVEVILSDVGASCATCHSYAKNTPIHECVDNVCGEMLNKQSALSGMQYFTPVNAQFACILWEKHTGEYDES